MSCLILCEVPRTLFWSKTATWTQPTRNVFELSILCESHFWSPVESSSKWFVDRYDFLVNSWLNISFLVSGWGYSTPIVARGPNINWCRLGLVHLACTSYSFMNLEELCVDEMNNTWFRGWRRWWWWTGRNQDLQQPTTIELYMEMEMEMCTGAGPSSRPDEVLITSVTMEELFWRYPRRRELVKLMEEYTVKTLMELTERQLIGLLDCLQITKGLDLTDYSCILQAVWSEKTLLHHGK